MKGAVKMETSPGLQRCSIAARTLSLLIIFALGFLVLSQTAQAVSPPPDGGYPGGNTAAGQSTLFSLTTGGYNTAVGLFSLLSNTEGNFNTASGAGALLLNTANSNTATGAGALLNNTTGSSNTANGAFALFNNTTGTDSTAVGSNALLSNTTGSFNTATGIGALLNNTIGNNNTANGYFALVNNPTGSNNTVLGYAAGANLTGDNNVCIGFGVSGVAGESFTTRIGNIWGQRGGTQAVYVDADGRLGANTSSRRFKEEIKPMDKASEVIYSLKPVSFRYKTEIEPTRPLSFGLIAEDVEQINADLVIRGKDGKVSTVRYEAVNAMLLNEFLKEHRKVQELEKGMATLTAQFEEQAAQIQKVGARVQSSRPLTQVALTESNEP